MARRSELTSLERAGVIQRFEGAWEQAWKSMRDYMRATGVRIETPTVANVIRAAFQVELIGDSYLSMLTVLEARLLQEIDRGN